MLRTIIICFFVPILSGCIIEQKKESACPPPWYLNRPEEEGYRYGVGKSDPTYLESKAKEIALTSALSDLAKQKRISIMSYGEYRSTAQASSGKNFEDSAQYTKEELQGAEVVEEYVSDGSNPKYPKGTYFILVRIKESLLFSR